MIIRDRETGTLWQHATGGALVGPLKGAQLELLGGNLMTWAAWKQAYPETKAALEPEKWTGILPLKLITALLERITEIGQVPGKTRRDERLPAHEPVIGISIEGEHRAYPLRLLRKSPVIEEQFDGNTIRLEYDITGDSVHVFVDGAPLWFHRTWWTGWYEFHPTTSIYQWVMNPATRGDE